VRFQRRQRKTLWYLPTHGCPCGHYGDPTGACTCPEAAVSRYRKRLYGPMLDRIDLHVEVPRLEYDELTADGLVKPR
jgi:magnesium chelatase family protein